MNYVLTGVAKEKVEEALRLGKTVSVRLGSGPDDDRVDSQEQQASDVYIARTPVAGIPALNDGYTGTGTSTNTNPADDTPGYAYCDVYQLIDDSTGRRLKPVGNLELRVYNLSTTAISGESWVTVVKDKFGKWVVPIGVTAGTSGTDTTSGMKVVDAVHVVEVPYTGTGTGTDVVPNWYCERAYRSGSGLAADPTFIYEDVYEHENRYPRRMDSSGGAVTHIIPLFQDVNGRYFIVYPKVDTYVEISVPTSFNTSFNTLTCVMTITPVYTTYRINLDVTAPADRTTYLTLSKETV